MTFKMRAKAVDRVLKENTSDDPVIPKYSRIYAAQMITKSEFIILSDGF